MIHVSLALLHHTHRRSTFSTPLAMPPSVFYTPDQGSNALEPDIEFSVFWALLLFICLCYLMMLELWSPFRRDSLYLDLYWCLSFLQSQIVTLIVLLPFLSHLGSCRCSQVGVQMSAACLTLCLFSFYNRILWPIEMTELLV
jgi:hypothetical protein